MITVPIPLVDPNQYFVSPSVGFNRPDFSTADGLTSWRKFAEFDFATSPFVTLVDFMDDTDYNTNQGGDIVAAGTGIPQLLRFLLGEMILLQLQLHIEI